MTRRRRSQQVLRHLIESAQREPAPDVDFERLQAVVRQAWLAGTGGARRPLWHWRWLPAVAIASAVSFFVGGWYGHAHHQMPSAPLSAAVPQALDGRVLLVGQELEAEREPLIVQHPGVAKWTLAPEGIARITSKGEHVTVRLDAGRIDAEVVPSSVAESFAVEVGDLRIAVHGTVFSVQRHDDFVEVTVTRGSVFVGPVGQPARLKGTLLQAPARERFAIHPVLPPSPVPTAQRPVTEGSVSRTKPSASAPPSTASASPAALASAQQTPAPTPPLPDRPTRLEMETALDAARAAAARCFAQASVSGNDSQVSVRVETDLSVSIAPSGTISEMSFLPPVPQTIIDCTRHEVAEFTIGLTQLGGRASRRILLMH